MKRTKKKLQKGIKNIQQRTTIEWYEKNKKRILEERNNNWKENKERINKLRRDKTVNRNNHESVRLIDWAKNSIIWILFCELYKWEKRKAQNRSYTIHKEGRRSDWSGLSEKEVRRKWYLANKEREQIQSKRWMENNKERYLKTKRNWDRMKSETDPMYRLNRGIRKRMCESLNGNKGNKHWENLVGYTLRDLKQHLEKLFSERMSWKNYGKWHIDHKIPISLWKYEMPEDREFKQCWALTNLQPLWARENIAKHNKVMEVI